MRHSAGVENLREPQVAVVHERRVVDPYDALGSVFPACPQPVEAMCRRPKGGGGRDRHGPGDKPPSRSNRDDKLPQRDYGIEKLGSGQLGGGARFSFRMRRLQHVFESPRPRWDASVASDSREPVASDSREPLLDSPTSGRHRNRLPKCAFSF
jgi:hypothetical protein